MTEKAKRKKFKFRSIWWCYPISLLLVIVYLLPILVLLIKSVKTVTDLGSNLSLPDIIYWGNYKEVLTSTDIWVGFKNSILLCAMTVALEIILGAAAAYGIARSSSRLVKIMSNLNMAVMMIPNIALLVGTYSLMLKLKMTNTLYGLSLLTAAGGMSVTIFMYMNFIISIPKVLDEAAAVDGAGVVRTFVSIIMPQLKPVTVTRVIMAAVGCWNNYLMPMYLLTDKSKFTIILVIKEAFNRTNGMGNLPKACATCAVGLIPIIVLYLLLQKQIIEGQMDSSVKG